MSRLPRMCPIFGMFARLVGIVEHYLDSHGRKVVMFRYISFAAIVALMFSASAVAQSADENAQQRLNNADELILIDDPEPVETEYFLAEGAATAEIVTDEELEMEAVALAALTDDMEGDMAAMPDIVED